MPAPAPAAPSAAGYRTLRVWQRALDVAVDAAHLARTLAAAGHERLAADLPRAAAAVPAHIAAGSTAGNRADYHRALGAALAAVARLETAVALAARLAPDAAESCTALLANSADLSRQLRAFARVMGTAPAIAGPRANAPAHASATLPAPTGADATAPADATPDRSATPPAATASPPAETIVPPMPTRPARTRRARPQPS